MQPRSPSSPPDPKSTGCHFRTVIFLNFNTIQWGIAEPAKAGSSAAVLILDSLRTAVTSAQEDLMKASMKAFVAQEAVARFGVESGSATSTVDAVPWIMVRLCQGCLLCQSIADTSLSH